MNSFNSVYSSNSKMRIINAPIINSVSYPNPDSATIYFTPSTSKGITDYKYSIDGGDTYTTTGYTTNANNYYFTIPSSGNYVVHLIAVINNLLSSDSSFNIITNYMPKATITGNGKILYTRSYEYYVFTTTSTSTLTFNTDNTNIEYVLIGAGGNGGAAHGGGGGAGQVRNGSILDISNGKNIIVTVGAPAPLNSTAPQAQFFSSRGNSTTLNSTSLNLNEIAAIGGGSAGSQYAAADLTGASGGGGASYNYPSRATGIAGNDGGAGYAVAGGGGGGGAGSDGQDGFVTGVAGAGGSGTSAYSEWILSIASYMNSIYTDWSKYTISNGIGYIASGGAGGGGTPYYGYTLSTIGGGGNGGTTGSVLLPEKIPATIGIPYTGGGAGGMGGNYSGGNKTQYQGGSGLVIIRIPF